MQSLSEPLSDPIAGLVAELTQAIRGGDRGRRIADLLAGYASAHEDWRDYARGEDGRYTRNLIELTDDYELLLLCWGSGQESPVHNHEGQDCWMVVLEGPMEEVHYAFPDDAEASNGSGALDAGPVRTFRAGEVAFIRDEIALHQVRATQGTEAVSLHLYAKPFGECNCYCEETGRITRSQLVYHSVRGVLNGSA